MFEPRKVPCAHCGGTGQITLPPEIEIVEVYYFGCWRDMGHYWWSRDGGRTSRAIDAIVPEPLRHGYIDSRFCPGATRVGAALRHTRPEVEGEAALHHVEGWTVLAWWDHSIDSRSGSNSALVAHGTFSFFQMMEIGRLQYPSVLTRQKTLIKLVQEEK